MNKRIIIASTAVFMLMTGCNLNEDLNDSITKEQANAILGATESLKTTYEKLQAFETTDNNFTLQEHSTDEMAGPTRGGDWDDNGVWRSLHLHTWTPDNARVIGAWEGLYQGLAFAIDTQSYKDITPSQKAQAVFLQALFGFEITDLFGQLSMRVPGESVSDLPSIQLKRTEATDYLIKILEAQLPNLPNGTAASSFIANKNAGNALLAKMYLNRAVYKATDADGKPQIGPFTFDPADMAKVKTYCDAAMAGRSLQTNYFENFAPNNGEVSNELIFTGQNTNANSPNIHRMYFMTLHYNQNPSGWNGFVALTDLYNKFDANDPRLSSSVPGLTNISGIKGGLLVGQQKDQTGANIKDRQGLPLVYSQTFSLANSSEEKGMRAIKYQPDYTSLQTANNDWVFIRLSDVMLFKAEAMARSSDLPGAMTIVNSLRTSRGVAPLASVGLSEILDERARELYWEGHRRQDLIRFSKFNLPVQERSTTTDRHVLVFPIPLNKLAANPNLKQNPGY